MTASSARRCPPITLWEADVEFTAQQKLDAVERELKFRIHVYKRRIEEGKMTLKKADYECDVMRAIALDYQKLADKEKLL
jgi:hypothetical protein